MSGTQERTAAEVMGWEQRFFPGSEYAYTWVDPDGQAHPRVEPDDMLAWMLERGAVSVLAYRPGEIHVDAILRGEREGRRFQAPTLYAALEQAVIAVGRAGIEPATEAL